MPIQQVAIIPSAECQSQWGVAKIRRQYRLVELFQKRHRRSIRGYKANINGAFSKLKLLENTSIRAGECNNESCQAFSYSQKSLIANNIVCFSSSKTDANEIFCPNE